MGAIPDFATYKKLLDSPRETIFVNKPIAGNQSYKWASMFNKTNGNAVTPTGPSVVPSRTLAGAMGQENAAAEDLYIPGAHILGNSGVHVLIDRLAQNAGQSGIDTTVNSVVNLPTAPLTRYTSGEGVMACIDIWLNIGSTLSTVTCSYTNSAGVAGRISPPMSIGGSGYSSGMWMVPLMAGDTGVRSIQSSTLAGTTGTAGSFGFLLYKPLLAFITDQLYYPQNFSLVDGGMCGGMPSIQDEACLSWMTVSAASGTPVGLFAAVPFTAA